MPTPTCALCARPADPLTEGDPPLGWTAEIVDPGRPAAAPSLICPSCTREYVRSIEAKLDRTWW